MFNIGLTEFVQTPWTERIREAMFNALSTSENICCEKILKYPKKNYDILILVGIRSISKRNLDVHELKKYAKILVEVGDDGIGFQRNGEDYYFYFFFLLNNHHLNTTYIYLSL